MTREPAIDDTIGVPRPDEPRVRSHTKNVLKNVRLQKRPLIVDWSNMSSDDNPLDKEHRRVREEREF